MRPSTQILVLLLFCCSALPGKVVVFWESGFPAAESEAVPREVLARSFPDPVFAGLDEIRKPEALGGVDLLVLPYGSAFPADAWQPIHDYLRRGGNLLNLGGRPLAVPVRRQNGRFIADRVQNTFARSLFIRHTYEAPQKDFAAFAWDEDHFHMAKAAVKARRVFVLGSGRGIGFLLDARGNRIGAAVLVRDAFGRRSGGTSGRQVFLPFEPEPGYWSSPNGAALLRQAAGLAAQKSVMLWLEVHNATVVEGEIPQVVVHVRGTSRPGTARIELLSGARVLDSRRVEYGGEPLAENIAFQKALAPGPYTLRGVFEQDGKIVEVYHTGFWSRDAKVLASGDRLEVNRDFFVKRGAPFVPFGVNYFSGDRYPTGFFTGGHIAGNSYCWERDFAEMERSHVAFVRTGVWLNHAEYLNGVTGEISERFLRALEAYLLSAGRHNIQVNFTFFAFDPQTVRPASQRGPATLGPGSNPYTDPAAIQAQKTYVSSIVRRFKDVPYLSWDLINEPTFSNPAKHFSGNVPNGDPSETAAWNRWLEKRYGSPAHLAEAWGVPPEDMEVFGRLPLPDAADLTSRRGGSSRAVRAVDYNLFAQDAFSAWARQMVETIRAAGSKGLVTIGQDEGGVTNRVLNQFYGGSGVNFTVNHTWWQDDALLWDSVAARRPDMPNLIGETGVQPITQMDDSARQDEINAFGLEERKLALAFAAGNSGGSLHWTWEPDGTFGMTRGDGSQKTWRDLLVQIGAFAGKAAPYLTKTTPPEVAIVLPQSLQLSVHNKLALEAQQKCVRALYHYARGAAYAVGEYQLGLLGSPKLIVLPAPWVLSEQAWETLLDHVRSGADLLVSGRIDLDEHFRPTDRGANLDIGYRPGVLLTRENLVEWPGGRAWFTYAGDKTDLLDRGFLASGAAYAEKQLGKGKLLYFAPPVEFGEDLRAIGAVYAFALKQAGVSPVYTTQVDDAGILICPTQLENATLYVLTSETSTPRDVPFRDSASGKEFHVKLAPGRAALLVVRRDGGVGASYNAE